MAGVRPFGARVLGQVDPFDVVGRKGEFAFGGGDLLEDRSRALVGVVGTDETGVVELGGGCVECRLGHLDRWRKLVC